MGLASWLNLKPLDVIAFLISAGLGYLAGTYLPDGPYAVYGSILISYHLFLAWLVISADGDTGISLPLIQAVATHLACLVLIAGFGMGRHVIPYFGYLRYGIAGMAIFERGWLFSGGIKTEVAAYDAPAAAAVDATAEDDQAWVEHLARKGGTYMRAGSSVKAEYEKFVRARAKGRPAAPSQSA